MEKAYYLGDAGEMGRGVFAAHDIPAGEYIMAFHGQLLTQHEVSNFTHSLQIDRDLWLGPSGDADDFINHSCMPNCGVVMIDNIPWLRSIAAISAKQELTFDYSTMSINDPFGDMNCLCGIAQCRGVVTDFPDLPREVKRRYMTLGVVPAFVLDEPELVKIRA